MRICARLFFIFFGHRAPGDSYILATMASIGGGVLQRLQAARPKTTAASGITAGRQPEGQGA
jgi:hypothetical protein